MFRGNSFHSIDPKGRLAIPARFRDVINAAGGGVMLTVLGNGLYAYTFDEWSKIETRVLSMAETSEIMRRFRLFFIGGAHRCLCDKQNRILIPQVLREDTGLDKEVVLAGLLNHFEIWSRENWEAEKLRMREDMHHGTVGAEIAKLGL